MPASPRPLTPSSPLLAPDKGAQTQTLRQLGLRATAPRRRILELFERAEQRHLTAEEVYRQLGSVGEPVSLATVYRALSQLETAGVLLRHHLDAGRSVFELSRSGHHNHLICIECGKMRCFTDEVIERRQREIAREHGYELIDYSLYTYVRCQDDGCAHRATEADAQSDGEPE